MNEANIEIKFQLSAPLADRGSGLAARDSDGPAFSNQLWQLTAPQPPSTGLSPPRGPQPYEPRALYGPADDDRPTSTMSNNQSSSESDGDRRQAATTAAQSTDSATGSEASARSSDGGHDGPSDKDAGHDEESKPDHSADGSQAAAASGPAQPKAVDMKGKSAAGDSDSHECDAASEKDAAAQARVARSDRATSQLATEVHHNVDADESAQETTDHSETDEAIAPNVASRQSMKAGQNGWVGEVSVDHAAAKPVENAAQLSAKVAENAGCHEQAGARENAEGTIAGQRNKGAKNAKTSLKEATSSGAESSTVKVANHEEATAGDRADKAKSQDVADIGDATSLASDNSNSTHGKESGPRQTVDATNATAVPVVSANALPNAASGTDAGTTSADDKKSAGLDATNRIDGLTPTLTRNLRAGQGDQAGQSKESPELNRADAARFVGRVTRAFHTAQERGGTLQLRLSPPELGSLHLELSVKDGVLNARLEAETAAARRLLLDHLPALRDRLAEQNVRVERFDVNVRRDGQEGQPDASPQQQQQRPQQRQNSTPSRRNSQQTSQGQRVAPIGPVTSPIVNNSELNLIV